MHLWQTIIFALVQGVTELFPISSVGHGVLLPFVLNWPNIQADPTFLPFLVALHLGTAIALFLFFFSDWMTFLKAVFTKSSGKPTKQVRLARREFVLLVVGTLPAVFVGGLFESQLKGLFSFPLVAIIFLIVNGIVLIYGDRLLRRKGSKEMVELNFEQILIVGVLESLALIPGFSRSGMTMIGGLLFGLRYEAAARLSFLLATPVILGAAVKELPKLAHSHGMLTVSLVGGVMAGIAAYASTWFLMRYFRKHEMKALKPFGIYCVAAGLGAFVWSLFI